MQKSTLSARAAAEYLGFASSNPVLDAIRAGELEAERGPGGRNGKPGNFRIRRDELDRYAKWRGLDPAEAPRPELESEPDEATAPPEVFNVNRIVPLPRHAAAAPVDQLGYVTIPIEHYAQLVADRAELRLLREHPELLRKDRHETEHLAQRPSVSSQDGASIRVEAEAERMGEQPARASRKTRSGRSIERV